MAHAAEEAHVDYLAVAHLSEAIKLREAQISCPILVLGAIHEEQIPQLLEHNLEFTLSSSYKAEMVAKICQALKKTCRVHLEVDTGMRRTGMRPNTAAELFTKLSNSPYFHVVGIYSHLATGSDINDAIAFSQVESFASMLNKPPFLGKPLLAHLANSPGALNFPSAYFNMVRPALLSFGYVPKNHRGPFSDIRPCFSLKARVSYFKIVEANEGISYGHSFIAKKRSRIVTIPVGYGDGYRRELSNRGHVLLRGQRFPIVGTICMDQFMVDVGDNSIFVGDEAVLIGRQENEEITVQEIADHCRTIPYEILCLFNERIPRIYINKKRPQ
jgi:alanine racemase